MSITLVKHMLEQFNYRHEKKVQAKLSSKDINESQFDSYRNSLLNIQDKSGFWGALEQFFAKCCDTFLRTHMIADQQEAIREEIKAVSTRIYCLIPDHSQITAATKKVLCNHKEQGYLISQEGFKIIAYSEFKIEDYEKGIISYRDKMELIDLTDKNKYNNLMLDLQAVHNRKEWDSYIKFQTERLTKELTAVKNISLEFAKANPDLFREETGTGINAIVDVEFDEEQVKQLIKFNLNHNLNPELAKVLDKFNSTLLKQIIAPGQPKLKAELGDIITGILEVLEPLNAPGTPTQHLDNEQVNQANLLQAKLNAIIVKRNGLKYELMNVRNSDIQQELFGIMLGIDKKLPPFEQLEPGSRNVVYVNHAKGYMVIQEGKRIFLQGKPFALYNPFKIELKSLSLANKVKYNRVKEKLNLKKVWQLVQQVKYTDKTLIEELPSIVYAFAQDNERAFNELFTVEKAQELGITLSQNLKITEISANDEESIQYLVLFFLSQNEEIFDRLNLLATVTDSAYQRFRELAKAQGSTNEQRNLGFLHEIIPKLKTLKQEKPELFLADTSLKLLGLVDKYFPKGLYTYSAQDAATLELGTLGRAIKNNAFLFNRYTIIEAENPEEDISTPKEVDDEVAKINDNQADMPELAEEDQLILKNKKKVYHNLQLLKNNQVNRVSLAEHYIGKLKAFYAMLGLTEEEIPEHPISDDGKGLNPILGKKIKAYLAQNRHIQNRQIPNLNPEQNNLAAKSMPRNKAVTPVVSRKMEPAQVKLVAPVTHKEEHEKAHEAIFEVIAGLDINDEQKDNLTEFLAQAIQYQIKLPKTDAGSRDNIINFNTMLSDLIKQLNLEDGVGIFFKSNIETLIKLSREETGPLGNSLIDHKGKEYINISDEVSDGNCGIHAMNVALNDSRPVKNIPQSLALTRQRMVEVNQEYFRIAAALSKEKSELAKKENLSQVSNLYAKIFNHDINLLKAFLLLSITTRLENLQNELRIPQALLEELENSLDENSEAKEDIRKTITSKTSTINSLEEFKAQVNSLTNFEFNRKMCRRILNCDLGIATQYMLQDSGLRYTNNVENDISSYVNYAKKSGSWLNRDEIVGYMLHKGYVLINSGANQHSKDQSPNMKTVLQFKSLTGPYKIVYIANDAQPVLNDSKQGATGTHWFCVIPKANG
jgi:hypothetical protein